MVGELQLVCVPAGNLGIRKCNVYSKGKMQKPSCSWQTSMYHIGKGPARGAATEHGRISCCKQKIWEQMLYPVGFGFSFKNSGILLTVRKCKNGITFILDTDADVIDKMK